MTFLAPTKHGTSYNKMCIEFYIQERPSSRPFRIYVKPVPSQNLTLLFKKNIRSSHGPRPLSKQISPSGSIIQRNLEVAVTVIPIFFHADRGYNLSIR